MPAGFSRPPQDPSTFLARPSNRLSSDSSVLAYVHRAILAGIGRDLVGDRAIRHVCDAMAGRIPACDLLFRWRGEEFLVLLPDCDRSDGEQRAWELCRGLRAMPLRKGDRLIPITVSIGLTTWKPGESQQALIARADHALYLAKERGRDQVVAG